MPYKVVSSLNLLAFSKMNEQTLSISPDSFDTAKVPEAQ